jgi:NitT/TauT family transport system ATP-binding protein
LRIPVGSIDAENVCIDYGLRSSSGTLRGSSSGTLRALDSVSLRIEAGQFVSIVGPSGCGKTSLLEAMIGLRQISMGNLMVCGKDPKRGLAPEEASIVFQEDSTFPWRTALRNVEFPLEIEKRPKKDRTARALHALDLVGLSGFAHAYPSELSGGMRQRLAIARALVSLPQVLLLDEPFGALDEQTRMHLGIELVKAVSDVGSTVVLVTHSVQEAVLLSDRVIVLTARPGSIVDIVDVNLARDRNESTLENESFQSCCALVWKLLRSEERLNATMTDGSPPVQRRGQSGGR